MLRKLLLPFLAERDYFDWLWNFHCFADTSIVFHWDLPFFRLLGLYVAASRNNLGHEIRFAVWILSVRSCFIIFEFEEVQGLLFKEWNIISMDCDS